MTSFRFKQLVVRQDLSPMKVGTDGVLLGAWATVRASDRRMLDIGTGTRARIAGIDIEEVAEARANADASPWGERIEMVQESAQTFSPGGRFDLVVSNPPFFDGSLPCPDAGRTAARHTVRLSFEELRDAAVRLLAPEGRFAVVLPADAATRFIALCCGPLDLVRRTDVRTTPRRPAKRVLLEFTPAGAGPAPVPERTELTVGTGEHECYTPEYRALTRDFYLRF